MYDLNGDGLITKTEMLDVVSSIYEMLGRATQPAVEDTSAKEHVEKIFHVRKNSIYIFPSDISSNHTNNIVFISFLSYVTANRHE